jgi:hypothetical protein
MTASEQVRFWAKVDLRGKDECWMWLASKCNGYGQFAAPSVRRGPLRAHRVAYTLLIGPIPDGLTLDHLCHDPKTCEGGPTCPHRACVNPDHMDPVTLGVNVMRGQTIAATNAAKTHCDRGHEFTRENTMLARKGKRRNCRTCHNDRRRKTAA